MPHVTTNPEDNELFSPPGFAFKAGFNGIPTSIFINFAATNVYISENMKNLLFAAFVMLALTCSCTDKSKEAATIAQADSTATEADGPTIDRNHEITVLDTIEWRNNTYYADIHRYPVDDSTNIIKDEMGDMYADNCIDLKITCGGKVFYKNTFRKSTFRQQLPDEFYGKYRLNGLVFDKVVDGNLQFAASVGNPSQDDEYIPYNIIISSNGSMSITKAIDLDTSSKSDE